MECGRGMLSSFFSSRSRREREKSERSAFFLQNGSKLLEEFIVSWNGRCSIPIPNFSAEELIRATNNFDSRNFVYEDSYYLLYRGSAGKRPVLVKKYQVFMDICQVQADAVRDITMTSQMSSHKNAVKLIGCCLEFELPVLIYEDDGRTELLSRLLYIREGEGEGEGVQKNGSLSWRSRLSIAYDIAYACVYLHTAFPTPIIHRGLKPYIVAIDQLGVAKLLDFSLSIAIPPGKSYVEDIIVGTYGFAEPQYIETGILTEKADVYSFGMILLQLLTGHKYSLKDYGGNYVREYVDKGQLNEIVDSRIRGDGAGAEQEQQWQAFVELAFRCLQKEREDRPEMIDVAKELKRIQRLVLSTPHELNHNRLI